jgi:hypothetical protein
MIRLESRVFNGSKDVLTFERRIIFEDLFVRNLSAQKFQDVADPNSHAAYAWTSTALPLFDGDS